MKAILVIDIPNKNLWKTSNDIYERMKGYRCELKPMPEKNTWGITKNGHVTEYAEGWNACLDEIMGETE